MKKHLRLFGIMILGIMVAVGCSSVTDGNLGKDNLSSHEITVTAESNGKAKGKNHKDDDSTVVPGHQTEDGSIPVGDVNGKYTSVYTYDANDDYYWDLGAGRVQGTVDSIDDLDQSTLTTCDYVVTYRGDFNGDPFLDSGWIRNNIKCHGYDYSKTQTYNTLYVHETDPKYSENLEPIWGSWGVLVDAVGGVGNVANPQHPVNN